MTRHWCIGLLAALGVALFLSAGSLEAATINASATAAEGVVDDDLCSLHEAIIEANTPGTHSGGSGRRTSAILAVRARTSSSSPLTRSTP